MLGPWRVLLRVWTLDASWHPERMQALGVLYALLPVLRTTPASRPAFERHAAAFNANLWVAPALIAATARAEADGRGSDAERVRDVVAPVLSGIGDAHVWRAVRPACVTLAVTGALLGAAPVALATALALHAGLLFWEVGRGSRQGLALGGRIAAGIEHVRPSARVAHAARVFVTLAAAAWCTGGLSRAWQAAPSTAFLMSGALLLGYTAAKRQLSPRLVFLGLVALVSVLRRFSNPVGLP